MPDEAATDGWKTQAEAAEILGCSEKTVTRLAGQKRIQKVMRPNPGRRPTPVYNADDIEVIRAKAAQVEAFPVPAAKGPVSALDELPGTAGPGAGAAAGDSWKRLYSCAAITPPKIDG